MAEAQLGRFWPSARLFTPAFATHAITVIPLLIFIIHTRRRVTTAARDEIPFQDAARLPPRASSRLVNMPKQQRFDAAFDDCCRPGLPVAVLSASPA